jgi:dTDP-4-dehydrorhamnose 3,5-epimerase-like enzyme
MLAEIKQLKINIDDRGCLTEIFRLTDDHHGFGQTYITTCTQGVIKAWHRHSKQIDRWYCVSGAARLGLYNSETNQSQTIILSSSVPILVTIPAGVWHGFTPAWGYREVAILNIVSKPYNIDNPDEDRVGPYEFDYSWNAESK